MKNSSQRNNSQNLAEYLRSFPLKEGENKTAVPYFNIYRFTSKKIRMPQTDDPYLYVVADGSMRLYTPSGIMDYPAGQYSISEIDTPLFGHVLTFSDKGDFLAMSLGFTVNDVITVVLDLDDNLAEQILASKLSASDMAVSDKRVINSVIRLLSVLGEKPSLHLWRIISAERSFSICCAVPVGNSSLRAL